MHAVMRRVPVERARHAKRLGHAGLANPIVTPTQPTATSPSQTPSPAIPSSSGALSASLTAQSSSVSSSSATSSTSTLSSASSSNTQSLVTATPSSSSTPARPTVSTYPTSSSTSTTTNASAVSHSGLSGGALAGIIAGSVIVGVAFLVFLVRKTYLRRRERKRISWNGMPGLGAGIPDEPKFPDISERLASDLNPPQAGPPFSPFEAHGQPMYSTPVPRMQPPTMPPYAVPAVPSATYNNPAPLAAYPTQPVPPAYNRAGSATPFVPGRAVPTTASTLPRVRGQHAPLEAVVKCTFVPSLPDELSITTGERVFVLEQYDDGWDLCANARSERGMVPRDCLDHAPTDQPGIGWGVARTSSLNPDGTRY